MRGLAAPGVHLAPAEEARPLGVETRPFVLRNTAGRHIRGLVQGPADGGPATPVIVLAAGLGVTMHRLLLPAAYLLTRGYRVVRFDPTNAVGLSDGDVRDTSLTQVKTDFVEVLQWARDRFGEAGTGALATSMAGRAALRAVAENPGLVDLLGTIACVAHVRATVTAATGEDRIGRWLAGAVPDRDLTTEFLDDVIRWNAYANLTEDGWDTLESTCRDVTGACDTSLVNVHGENDPWIATSDVVTAFAAAPNARVVVMGAAVHELNFASARVAIGTLLDEFTARLPPPGTAREPEFDQFVALNKVDRTVGRRLQTMTLPADADRDLPA